MDYLERLPADVLPVLERNRAVRVQVVSPFGFQALLRFNHLHPPFDDVRVREDFVRTLDALAPRLDPDDRHLDLSVERPRPN